MKKTLVRFERKFSRSEIVSGQTSAGAAITFQDGWYYVARDGGAQYVYVDDRLRLIGEQNTVTGIKGGAEDKYRTGNVNITPANIGLGNVENKSQAELFSNPTVDGWIIQANQPVADHHLANKAYVDGKVAGLYHPMGSMASREAIEEYVRTHTGYVKNGWVYNALDTNMNYAVITDERTTQEYNFAAGCMSYRDAQGQKHTLDGVNMIEVLGLVDGPDADAKPLEQTWLIHDIEYDARGSSGLPLGPSKVKFITGENDLFAIIVTKDDRMQAVVYMSNGFGLIPVADIPQHMNELVRSDVQGGHFELDPLGSTTDLSNYPTRTELNERVSGLRTELNNTLVLYQTNVTNTLNDFSAVWADNIAEIHEHLDAFGTAAGANLGTSAGNVPTISGEGWTSGGYIVVTDGSGHITTTSDPIGSAATKNYGADANNIPVLGSSFAGKNGQLVSIDANGKLVPSLPLGNTTDRIPVLGGSLTITGAPILVSSDGTLVQGTSPLAELAYLSISEVAGTDAGMAPVIGTDFSTGTSFVGRIVTTDKDGKLVQSATTLGTAAGYNVGTNVHNLPMWTETVSSNIISQLQSGKKMVVIASLTETDFGIKFDPTPVGDAMHHDATSSVADIENLVSEGKGTSLVTADAVRGYDRQHDVILDIETRGETNKYIAHNSEQTVGTGRYMGVVRELRRGMRLVISMCDVQRDDTAVLLGVPVLTKDATGAYTWDVGAFYPLQSGGENVVDIIQPGIYEIVFTGTAWEILGGLGGGVYWND